MSRKQIFLCFYLIISKFICTFATVKQNTELITNKILYRLWQELPKNRSLTSFQSSAVLFFRRTIMAVIVSL
nr:MAG TPA: hypothetical protein [Caudoviricetes sp.]